MVTDFFGVFLQELGAALHIPNLRADTNNSCQIQFPHKVLVQMELDRTEQFLIVGTDLGTVSAGRCRENLFLEALKANQLPLPRYGTFGYSSKADHLVLFDLFPVKELSALKIAEYIPHFLEKQQIWRDAIAHGDVPAVAAHGAHSSGMFGLKM